MKTIELFRAYCNARDKMADCEWLMKSSGKKAECETWERHCRNRIEWSNKAEELKREIERRLNATP